MEDLIKALNSLRPNSSWICHKGTYESLEWKDENTTLPTKEEVDAEIIRLNQEYIDTEYQRNRQAEYPPLAEQLDYIYHNGVEAWKADMIQPVKDKYPKPE